MDFSNGKLPIEMIDEVWKWVEIMNVYDSSVGTWNRKIAGVNYQIRKWFGPWDGHATNPDIPFGYLPAGFHHE